MKNLKSLKNLENKIIEAKEAYYNLNEPIMSDAEFDSLVDELKSLDPKNQIANMVGALPRTSPWKKMNHIIQMGSQQKVNTPEELLDWSVDYKDQSFVVSEKIDGISISVIYEDGKFVSAITRGDGVIGEDISTNVVRMNGFKKELSDNFSGALRGEILMKTSIHEKFFPEMSNPRNGASGIAKKLSGENSDKLNIFFYQVIGSVEFKRKFQEFDWLKSNGLDTPQVALLTSANSVINIWNEYQSSRRASLDYWIDGLIVETNDLSVAEKAGEKDLCPNASRAFKFTNQLTITKIIGFDWQTGNSGRITPVCLVEPRNIQGSIVSKANAYNQAEINKLGLDVGAEVTITKCNEIIPRITSVVKGTGTVHKHPTICFVCGNLAEMVGENLTCPNTFCGARVSGRLKNWVNELNLLEWGVTLLDKLVDLGKVSTVVDLYKLSVDDLASIDRMGEKSAKKCFDILHSNKDVTLDVFLGGLSFPMIGASTIKCIMNDGCDTLEKFGKMKAEHFEQISGVGPVKAKYLEEGLIKNQKLILDLLDCGVTIKSNNGHLKGVSFSFTGSMVNKRQVLEKMATDAGADIKSGKDLTYLVIADKNSTSSKAVAARKNNTKVISEEDFLELVK